MSIFMMPTGKGRRVMSSKMSIPRDAIVFVGDGRRARCFCVMPAMRNSPISKPSRSSPTIIPRPLTRVPTSRVGYSQMRTPAASAAP